MYQHENLLIAILITALVTATIMVILHAKKSKNLEQKIKELDSQINDHQKSVHRIEADHIKSKNNLEVEHHNTLKEIKEKSYGEGYELGLAASHKDHLIEITHLKSLHREELSKQEIEAEKKGRAIAKIEHEATTSKIGEDQVFYCNQRGIPTEKAIALIVNGFSKEVLNKLPMEFAVEAQKLLEISLEGSVG